ncbi:unnamed protein product [Haemonchus placei]|uniref:Uncharacterized protein n=1 Tax=Haemonchus placei TaxID=6290 RepID=A0A3P7TZ93_HAEPC|nr:unnamed protein product [Haemonchus placei]
MGYLTAGRYGRGRNLSSLGALSLALFVGEVGGNNGALDETAVDNSKFFRLFLTSTSMVWERLFGHRALLIKLIPNRRGALKTTTSSTFVTFGDVIEDAKRT